MKVPHETSIELQVGVKVLLKNKEGKYLLVARNPKKYPEIGLKWDIVGGRIKPGTPLLDNLHREVMEETGLKISSEPKLVAAQDILRVHMKHIVRLTYIAEANGSPTMDDESIKWKWFTCNEILEIDKKMLDQYLYELIEKGIIVL